ncbi:helix-turn-helix domain-containing protein [Shouchella miscanthi]|uniref:Helix-turn-helix domain-containing protein n=1 Tax=Shouchella miscanthi TaxID=2598861 RepID=A0ABU6NJ14_9BACI|nr:helix-turn-helix domain-containing protein [Shouchella miscanthi]
MAKYSDEFKLKIIKEYVDGYLGYQLLAKKYNIPDTKIIRRWVRAFQAFGVDGIKRKRKKATYSVSFKLDVLHYMERTGASFQDTAIEFGLTNPPLISNWKKKYREKGVEGLNQPKGRPPMTKKKKQLVKKEESREKQLETEIEELRLEVAYLKKLNAFRENPDTFLEKHKQRWHSNSKKKDSH